MWCVPAPGGVVLSPPLVTCHGRTRRRPSGAPKGGARCPAFNPPRRCPGVAPRGTGGEITSAMEVVVHPVDVDDVRTIGARLRQIRNARKKSLRVIAGLAGVSASHLSRIERGERALDSRSETV